VWYSVSAEGHIASAEGHIASAAKDILRQPKDILLPPTDITTAACSLKNEDVHPLQDEKCPPLSSKRKKEPNFSRNKVSNVVLESSSTIIF